MNPNLDPQFKASDLIALRTSPDALKEITARLRAREKMGPADHIRTKHEVKAWLESSGDSKEAEEIVVRAQARRELASSRKMAERNDVRQDHGQKMGP
jgi:hypothetical protein